MKIVFISRYQRKAERGVENYAAELAPRLKKLGNKVEVLTSFWQLIGKRAEIIYPLNGYWQTLGCRLYAWLTGAKLVVGGHAGIGRDDRWNLYMFPDLFIAFSQKGYDWAKKVNPFIKIVKIPHGVNLQKFNPSVGPAKLNLDRPRFICVSHLVPYKQVDLTVKAVAKLGRGSLLILGEGPEAGSIDFLGKKLLGLGRYLRLVVPHSRVSSYLTAADVFTLVSKSSEAFGLVYLEALACGLPVVATDDPLRRELIGNAGIFVKDPENIENYAKCLETAVKINWKDRPAKQSKKYDWEKLTFM